MASRDDQWILASTAELGAECASARIRHRADTIYILMMAGRILAMQSGFGMLESAYVRPMNAANIMMKNLMDMCVGALIFWLVGYRIAASPPGTVFDEGEGFDYAMWFCQFSYATTAATINSGALAGRVSFIPYLMLSVVQTGFIFPLAANWVWGGGWLQQLGFVDFAGSAVVHLVGGISSLVSIAICGPRIGKFPKYRSWRGIWRWVFSERYLDSYYQGPITELENSLFSPIKPLYNPVQMLFGVFLLFCGFLAFNPASTYSSTNNDDIIAARATVTTTLCVAASGVSCFLLARGAIVTVPNFTTAVIGGMVASSACCHVVPPILMMVVGIFAGAIAIGCQKLITKLMFDDVVGAIACHAAPGIFGVLCVPLLAKPHCDNPLQGLVFGGGAAALRLLGIQVIGLLALSALAAVTTFVSATTIDLLLGFRCGRAAEILGLDFCEHGFDDGTFRSDAKKQSLQDKSPKRVTAARLLKEHSPLKAYIAPADARMGSENVQGEKPTETYHDSAKEARAVSLRVSTASVMTETSFAINAECTSADATSTADLTKEVADLRQMVEELTKQRFSNPTRHQHPVGVFGKDSPRWPEDSRDALKERLAVEAHATTAELTLKRGPNFRADANVSDSDASAKSSNAKVLQVPADDNSDHVSLVLNNGKAIL